MRARWIIRVLILGAIALFIAWIARNTYWDEVAVPSPLRKEAATNPFYAAQQFVEKVGATSTWDRVLTRVPPDAVIVLSAWHWDLVKGRRSRLEQWVESGGRLVMDHTLIGGEEAFEKWSGITRRDPRETSPDAGAGNDGDAANEKDEKDVAEQPAGHDGAAGSRSDCHMLHEASRAAGSRAGAPMNFELCGQDNVTHLFTTRKIDWALQDDTGNQVLRVKVGKGSVTLINAVPFRYRAFLHGDHAALLVAAAQLRRGDEVHFLSEERQASLLTLMWMYGWPVVLLALAFIALGLWRNSVRFGPLAAGQVLARRSLAEQIRGTGQFAVRFGGGKSLHAATVRALDEAARRRVTAYARLSTVERVEAVARLTGIDAATLGPAIHHSGPRRSHELRQAIALIESARRRLLIVSH